MISGGMQWVSSSYNLARTSNNLEKRHSGIQTFNSPQSLTRPLVSFASLTSEGSAGRRWHWPFPWGKPPSQPLALPGLRRMDTWKGWTGLLEGTWWSQFDLTQRMLARAGTTAVCDDSLLHSASFAHQESFAEISARLLRDLLCQLSRELQTFLLADSRQDTAHLAIKEKRLLFCFSCWLFSNAQKLVSDIPLLCWAGEPWRPSNGSESAQWPWRWRWSTRWGDTCSCTSPSCGAVHAGHPLWVCPLLLATPLAVVVGAEREARESAVTILGHLCSPHKETAPYHYVCDLAFCTFELSLSAWLDLLRLSHSFDELLNHHTVLVSSVAARETSLNCQPWATHCATVGMYLPYLALISRW